eukprot:SAG11_NODE_2136_length_3766_cov_6.499864_2_plen_108_part_00
MLVEKPGCLHLSEFESLCELADHSGLQLMLAMATRLNPAARQTKHLIERGFLGTPYSATMDWVADSTRLAPAKLGTELAWKYRKDKTPGGKLIYHGTHYIDALQVNA